MPQMLNPFDTGGFGLAELTSAINILPNQYGMLNTMGLFKREGVTQMTVLIEEKAGVLNLLPPVALGGPATVANRGSRNLRSFVAPYIPHNDVILPSDISGIRRFGSADQADPLTDLMTRRLTTMRMKHDQTLEYMEATALRGVLKGGDGTTLYNYFTEFGISQTSIDFNLGTATTDVGDKCRALKRHMETNLKGESMTSVLVLVHPDFWDAFITHPSVSEAYKFFQNLTGRQPLREDTRDGFVFHGVTFKEYNATVTLSDGSTTDTLIPTAEGVAFPMGTVDTFSTYMAPAPLLDTVNTVGQRMYAQQIRRRDESGIDLFTYALPLPIVKRPALVVRVYTST